MRFHRQFRKKRGFLRAADGDRIAARERLAEALDLGAAEMVRGLDAAVAAAFADCRLVERHRLFARTNENLAAH